MPSCHTFVYRHSITFLCAFIKCLYYRLMMLEKTLDNKKGMTKFAFICCLKHLKTLLRNCWYLFRFGYYEKYHHHFSSVFVYLSLTPLLSERRDKSKYNNIHSFQAFTTIYLVSYCFCMWTLSLFMYTLHYHWATWQSIYKAFQEGQ